MMRNSGIFCSGQFCVAVLAVFFALVLLPGCGPSTPTVQSDDQHDGPTDSSATDSGTTDSGTTDGGPSAEPSTRLKFEEMTAAAGVAFTPQSGASGGFYSIVETLGCGVAILDYNGDGRMDIFFTGGGQLHKDETITGVQPALYRNDGGWKFTDVTKEAGLAKAPFYSHGAAAADYNADGHTDLLITGYGGLLLYRNNGDGAFTEVTEQAGLTSKLWSTSAAWGDFNADGFLDVYIVNYLDWSFEKNHPCGSAGVQDVCPPGNYEPQDDILYLGSKDGTFTNGSKQAGLAAGGKGLGVVASDLDLDGDLDIYVANDTTPNRLYRNDGAGKFTETGLISGAGLSERGESDGSMGVDVGDYNQDGLPDIWVANYENQSFALYKNVGDCIFQHQSKPTRIAATRGVYVGFGTVFIDADRDGDEDIFAANGHVMRHSKNSPFEQVPLLFENHDGQHFKNVGQSSGGYFAAKHVGRGVARVDLDNDGRQDLVISHSDQPVAVLRNTSGDKGHWLLVQLEPAGGVAIGARVTVSTANTTQTKQLSGGGSYLSSNAPRIFFGLNNASTIEKLTVTWPSGSVQEHKSLPVDQIFTLKESKK